MTGTCKVVTILGLVAGVMMGKGWAENLSFVGTVNNVSVYADKQPEQGTKKQIEDAIKKSQGSIEKVFGRTKSQSKGEHVRIEIYFGAAGPRSIEDNYIDKTKYVFDDTGGKIGMRVPGSGIDDTFLVELGYRCLRHWMRGEWKGTMPAWLVEGAARYEAVGALWKKSDNPMLVQNMIENLEKVKDGLNELVKVTMGKSAYTMEEHDWATAWLLYGFLRERCAGVISGLVGDLDWLWHCSGGKGTDDVREDLRTYAKAWLEAVLPKTVWRENLQSHFDDIRSGKKERKDLKIKVPKGPRIALSVKDTHKTLTTGGDRYRRKIVGSVMVHMPVKVTYYVYHSDRPDVAYRRATDAVVVLPGREGVKTFEFEEDYGKDCRKCYVTVRFEFGKHRFNVVKELAFTR